MDTFEFLKSITSLTDKINKSIYPFKTNEWQPRINLGIEFNQLSKSMSYNKNHLQNHLFQLSNTTNLGYELNKTIFNQLNNNIGIIINNGILDKINSVGYWGNIAKLSLLNITQVSTYEEDIADSQIISNNIEVINQTIEEIEKNPIEFFNNLVIFIKTYIDKNPSVKYTARFILFFISLYITALITNEMSKNSDEKPTVNNITINNYYNKDNEKFKINCKFIDLKNFPRDNSKSLHRLVNNDRLIVLKDSLKWAFVIKENSIETGWIRKEHLKIVK
ncbi:SH3 domain-containing protein [Epilithonimonas xixisoli]|uniref:SH3 domain-containing protein n=1 Tax=Epilithonimonas xixisoli TaxID=1476462 RepID=A0A4R8I819_9FLAO|nr:SH3 domain-containing protein [Epilithonimonas xixisoli]TDX84605.1 hypothetical protein B0I22_2234 [Epilithonimonas xixisoli]